ncbi:disease resistance protein (TIR-NBS-LRR class) [Abeliophyllum distichum]|uniref:Disease resistance protein (TIR-NBS-LRR class) n=1 Tax=Abeliophyllum distichum TaxID=126358 RepID=A0ABD1RFW8_9LAMI
MVKLIEIELTNCYNCEEIPTLGHLPLLKYLKLEGLTNVRSIGLSFYGASDCSSTSRNDGHETRVSFPSLKSLIIEKMPNLTEWAEAQTSVVQKNQNLAYLELWTCKKLAYIPQLRGGGASLKELCIAGSDELRELPDDLGSLESLEALVINGCENLQLIPYPSGQKGLSSLRSLQIYRCKRLSNLPSEMLESCTSLQSLCVFSCENLTSFPEMSGMVWLNSIRDLDIGDFLNSNILEVIGLLKSV